MSDVRTERCHADRRPADGTGKWFPWPRELHKRSLQSLQRKVMLAPADPQAAMALGDHHRAGGNLTAACDMYARAARLDAPAAGRAAWLHALLAGQQLPHAPPEGLWPAPFARFQGFLPAAHQQRLLAAALAARGSLRPAGIGRRHRRRVDPNRRRGLELQRWSSEEFHDALLPGVLDVLPDVRRRLRMDPADLTPPSNPQLNVYPDGGFTEPHLDSWQRDVGATYASRGLMFIYYLHPEPLAFTGGDLLLYDSAVSGRQTLGYSRTRWSRLSPVSNSLVFFAPAYYHAIEPVASPRKDVAASRISIGGRLLHLS